MEEFIRFVNGVGFPIAVAAYLLIRFDGLLRDVHAAIKELTIYVQQLNHSDKE